MIDLPQNLLQRAAVAFDNGDLLTADNLCGRLLAAHPDHALAWLLRGRIRTRQSKFADAEAALDRARAINPNDSEVPHALGLIRMRQGRFEEALPILEKAQAMEGSGDRTAPSRAKCLIRLGEPRQALMILGAPSTPDACLAAGEAHRALGEIDAAVASLRRTTQMRGNAAAAQQAHQLLGEILDERGDFPAAFKEFADAKRYASVRFDPRLAIEAIGRLIETFDASYFRDAAKPSVLTKRPIFIVGMPRSGTTLLEKMIASHPHGAGAGETDALLRQVRSWNNPAEPEKSWPQIVRRFNTADLDAIVRTYLSSTETFAGRDVQRVADKHLQNWYHLGLIATAFPQATIIHIERDPFDTGLSCFQRLLPNAMPWSTDLTHIGATLALCEKLMAHWSTVLPGRLHRVRYEELVRSPATVLPPIIAACGLEWSDACLQQHLRKPRRGAHEPPPTLSVDQVKRPLYDTSIGRAIKYGSLLDPLRQAYIERRREFGLS